MRLGLELLCDLCEMGVVGLVIGAVVGPSVTVRADRDDPLGVIGPSIGQPPHMMYLLGMVRRWRR